MTPIEKLTKFISNSQYGFKQPELFINLTYKCPLRCEYCYVDYTKTMDFTFEDLTFLIENGVLKNNNIKLITFFGGEPALKIALIEQILQKFYSIFNDRGIHVAIITSFSVNQSHILSLMTSYPLFEVVISFDNHQEKRLLNNKPYKVLEHIELDSITNSQKRNLCFHIVMDDENSFKDLKMLREIYIKHKIIYSYCWNKIPKQTFDLSQYYDFLSEIINDDYIPKQTLKEMESFMCHNNIGCGIGSELFLSSNGDISPCSISHYNTDFDFMKNGDINEKSFETIEQIEKNNFKNEVCDSCDIKGFCNGGCILERKLNRNDYNSPNLIHCEIQHNIHSIYCKLFNNMSDKSIIKIEDFIKKQFRGNIDYCHNRGINIDIYDYFNLKDC